MLVVPMLQHGLGGLRASTTQPFIEFVDAHGVRTLAALECHVTPIFTSRLIVYIAPSITAASPTKCDDHRIPVTLVASRDVADIALDNPRAVHHINIADKLHRNSATVFRFKGANRHNG